MILKIESSWSLEPVSIGAYRENGVRMDSRLRGNDFRDTLFNPYPGNISGNRGRMSGL